MQDSALISLENIDVTENFSLSIYSADYHQGVIGILASRLKEKYHRPTIIFADAGKDDKDRRIVKGSGRSIPGLHLRDALDLVTKQYPSLIIKFGGHAMAAGLSILERDFDVFQQAFEAVARTLLTEADLQAVIETDGNLSANDMSLQTAQILASSVWGQGFAQPVFCDDFKVINQRIVGEKHLKLLLEKDQKRFDAIQFNSIENLAENITAVYALEANEYKGLQTLQLQIKQIFNNNFT
jgi:single-stranded-DNA-specific exonuclease